MLVLIISYICGFLACWSGLNSEVHFSINPNSTSFPSAGVNITLLWPLKTLLRFFDPLELATCALLRVPLPKSVREALWNQGIWALFARTWGSVPFRIYGTTNCSSCTIFVQSKSFRYTTSELPPMCCKQRTCAIPESFRCNIYKKHRGMGGGAPIEIQGRTPIRGSTAAEEPLPTAAKPVYPDGARRRTSCSPEEHREKRSNFHSCFFSD